MKHLLFIGFFTISILNTLAQDEPVVDLVKLQQETKNASIKFKQQLSVLEYNSDFEKSTTISFRVDTFLIEDLITRRMEIDFSIISTTDAYVQAENEYLKLVNKYYQILYNKLSEEDKPALKTAHENWLTFRAAENALTELLSKDEYSGGGAYAAIGVLFENTQINKTRAKNYYDKLIGIVM
jgi:hypothetical protein